MDKNDMRIMAETLLDIVFSELDIACDVEMPNEGEQLTEDEVDEVFAALGEHQHYIGTQGDIWKEIIDEISDNWREAEFLKYCVDWDAVCNAIAEDYEKYVIYSGEKEIEVWIMF